MSKQTVGKTLLRNVIRHTDAHNKIQEESEMWKLRGWEVQMSNHSHVSATRTIRGQMHCDRLPYESRVSSEHDDREARYWTKKLYEFEDNDPDRWGHSGFKELYPEEFESESDKSSTGKKEGHRRKVSKSKHSKKKKKKKKKKEEEAKRKKVHSSHEGNRTKSHHKGKKKDRKNEDRRGRKRKNDDSHKHSDSSKKSRRDWRAADEESTDESSEE
ncbi:NKAP domain containing 1 [Corythoichthys intestinalis]|uniref:NKAP domain containing 1 n=1 Tax=Corythoichthys intestinalis TaxID=161448 RepID=UPI0025A5B3EF|nr:NKAP domain containing 1 [Corythoichthys intestinalis]XP_057695198.1 NKAP domain containing 1 [Corythoichthys intestinalis]